MSDVNISTSWSSLPSSDTEYNTVLGAAGYDENDTRLFLSAQQVPGIARNVTTEYARGFRITSGYDGIVLHDAITETAADLKTVKFTMSMAGTAYDLTDARCYVQFKNHYTVEIASWALQAQAADDTLTTIASGGIIAAGAVLQIDFKNDYNAARFIMTATYATIPAGLPLCLVPNNMIHYTTMPGNLPVVTYGCACPGTAWASSPLPANIDVYCATVNGVGYVVAAESDMSGYSYINYGLRVYSGNRYYYQCTLVNDTHNGYKIATATETTTLTTGLTNLGYTVPSFSSYADFKAALVPGSGGTTFNTGDIAEYNGNVWQCRMIANVAAISPGPMATESEGGTEGNFDVTSDQITAPGIPSTYTQSYFGHIYLIDSGNLAAVASVINSNDFIDQFYTNFGDIAKCIVSVSQFPISTYSGAGTLGDITVGSKRISSASLTPQAQPLSRFATVDCGTVNLHLFWDSALDLNPYTKLSVYIPCVGMRPLDADVVMGHTLGLYYNVDFMTGNALAILTLDGDYYEQYSCTLATQYALNTEQWGPVYQGIMSTLSTAAIGVAVSGSGGAMAGALAGAATQSVAQKLHHDKAGTMGASMSLFSQMQPFIEILRPIQQLPRDYTKFNAYPSYMTSQLINLSGYVEVQDIRLDDIDCTDAERTELMSMLQSGVII